MIGPMASRIINAIFTKIVSPGRMSEKAAVVGSYLTISFLFVVDLMIGPEIIFSILYGLPLIITALHLSKTRMVITAVVFSALLQLTTLFLFQQQVIEKSIYLFVLIAFSNSICTLIARYCRAHTLEARRLSTLDPLTQINNRRAFQTAMEAEVARKRRYGGHMSVAIIDLDGFKGLNDTKGHHAGDHALMLVAGILRNQTRQTDTVARLGGDEFVILMPDTEATDCDTLCDSLCQRIRISMHEVFPDSITASIGCATAEHGAEASNLLAIADGALYRAKAKGKGCVVRGHVDEHAIENTKLFSEQNIQSVSMSPT